VGLAISKSRIKDSFYKEISLRYMEIMRPIRNKIIPTGKIIITSLHHQINTLPHYHITTSSHLHIITLPHHHIITSPHHHIITLTHHHITPSSHFFLHSPLPRYPHSPGCRVGVGLYFPTTR